MSSKIALKGKSCSAQKVVQKLEEMIKKLPKTSCGPEQAWQTLCWAPTILATVTPFVTKSTKNDELNEKGWYFLFAPNVITAGYILSEHESSAKLISTA